MFKFATTLVFLYLTCFLTFACNTNNNPPLIHAAASLVDVLTEIQTEYETVSPNRVRFNFAGSNLIANQIINGAPANAVILAGKTPIDKLVQADKTDPLQIRQFLTNSLVAVRSTTVIADHTDIHQLVDAGKIAMPDPATAPAGEYFQAALAELGLLEALEAQIVPTLDVRAALAAAESGNVAYALVYRTDAMTSSDVEIAFTIPTGSDETRPVYFTASIDDDSASADFLEFLRTPVARAIFAKHGFAY